MVQNFFAKIRYYKDKLLVWNSAITEVNKLRILNLDFSNANFLHLQP